MNSKRFLFLLSLSLLVVLGACSNKDATSNDMGANEDLDNLNETGFPIVDEPITIEFMTGKSPSTAEDYNEVLIWKEYEKKTNIHIDWGLTPREGLDEKRNIALASGEYPEAFHTAYIPDNDLYKYGQEGIFIPLNDLIEDYMPNLKKLLEEDPDIEKGITFPDGKVYSFPRIVEPDFIAVRASNKLYINQIWLKNLGMEMPETTEDFYQYLKAVKEGNPSGDENLEEVPFGARGIGDLTSRLLGSFGIANRGGGLFDIDPETEEMRFWPISDRYKELLEYVHKLYDEGLIEKNIFTIDVNQHYANGTEGLYGSTVSINPENYYEYEKNAFTGMPTLTGPHGDRMWTAINSPLNGKGFAITNKNKNPAATARWLDYFYSDEGAELFFMGIEGETFEYDENGEPQYVDEIADNPDGLSMQEAQKPYITYLGGGYPGIIKKQFFKGAESTELALEATEKIIPDIIDEVWPDFTYTDEERKQLRTLQTDIDEHVEEMRDKFISGQTSLGDWDKYVETIENMGLEDYMNIQEAAYKRYLED